MKMLITEEQQALLERAINTFGAGAQVRQLMEEAAELTQAANKYFNTGDWKATAEEYADIVIMIEQFRMIAGVSREEWDAEVKRTLQHKLNRLSERLKIKGWFK